MTCSLGILEKTYPAPLNGMNIPELPGPPPCTSTTGASSQPFLALNNLDATHILRNLSTAVYGGKDVPPEHMFVLYTRCVGEMCVTGIALITVQRARQG